MKKLLSLILALALIFFICHSALPRLAQGPGMGVVRSNMQSGVDATAYFYTEMDDFSDYELAVRQARAHPPALPLGRMAPK
jgi:hypothetical protein